MLNIKHGFNIEKLFIPDDLIAVISLLDDSFPNVISVVTKTAIGIANEIIHAELRKTNFKITSKDNP